MKPQETPIGDPPNGAAPKLAPGRANGVESQKVTFTPQQISEIVEDARKTVYLNLAYPKPGSICG